MQGYKKFSLYLVIFLLIFTVAGCRPAEERPEPEQQRDVEVPPIPEAIAVGEGQEPSLNVYIVEEQTVKELQFEEYVAGVLAGEMYNEWPVEALAAQAILARTFVMEFIADKGGSKYEGAHVSTDIEEAQAWKAELINERINEAVQQTRGQVMVYDGDFVKAWFHAHAGGTTATAQEGLGFGEEEPAYIQVIESPDSAEAPEEEANWSETFTKAEIIEAARQQGQEVGDFTGIEIAETGPSGRATQLKIGEADVPAPAFRIALGSTRMKSTLINNISVEGDQVTISGTGYGHGVGMSQWGAYQMAQDGSSPEEIVKHYFKDVDIVKLWD
ncbi:SpoIID/LytB domain-containing protein [Alkaliphilus transvaalensis]|uniref:SpoIID/LytB domain-containing protein n=1 Tax=Alkaliphilus transvaalensis TaxID=114628 RepID=UPI00047981B7|nr:SpoIID/LytB domain-containing protein [Alkaliphilus transvaalensis]